MEEKMAKVTEMNGRKYWEDYKGDLTAVENISKEDKARDKVVEACCAKAIKLNEQIAKTKAEITALIDEYLSTVAEKFGTEWKGNTNIINFSQDLRVDVKVQNTIGFDEKLNVAKNLIDECVAAWSTDANPALATIVNKAFETDRKGKINREFIFKLLKMKMNAKTHMDKWEQAMELLRDSMTIEGSKPYYNFRRRKENGEWELITLDFAAL